MTVSAKFYKICQKNKIKYYRSFIEEKVPMSFPPLSLTSKILLIYHEYIPYILIKYEKEKAIYFIYKIFVFFKSF